MRGEFADHTPNDCTGTHAPIEGVEAVRAKFQAREVAQVLSHYDLGVIAEIREYRRGSRRAPKLKLRCERGEFLLKRRAPARDRDRSRDRAAAGHVLETLAANAGVSVAGLVPLRSGGTLLELGEQFYEVHRWIPGTRYSHHIEQARAAGTALAGLHAAFHDIELLHELPQGGFSDIAAVRRAVVAAGDRAQHARADTSATRLQHTLGAIDKHLDRVEIKLLQKGLPLQRSAICHGDFHPGNTLWIDDALAAVIDFDSVRRESLAAELANALMQFSSRARADRDPTKWPVGLLAENLQAFGAGYASMHGDATREMAPLVPWLMIAAIAAEAASPIARDGNFAGIAAVPVLESALSMMDWIAERTRAIAAVLEA